MLSKVKSCAVVGLEGSLVDVEVDISKGLPAFTIVGLPDTAVQEARERVRGAIRNSGCEFPNARITVNLAPADLKKEGPAYDLPMALGILMSSGQLTANLSDTLLLGELSLDGTLRHTNAVLPMVSLGVERGLTNAVVPKPDANEAAVVDGATVLPAESLSQLVAYYRGEVSIDPVQPRSLTAPASSGPSTIPDFADIKGQEHAKRALEVAAAGGHNLIMSGPPGAGKTLMARALPGILPSLTPQEALDATKIYSVAGMLPAETPLLTKRPFRAPHYTISIAGLVGGGRWPRPGEITLSHRGVLFLDELPEFGQATLEVLRQPLEDRVVTISRAQGAVTFPANFMLVGSMNPCPCGFHGDPFRDCSCSPSAVTRYQKRISGPFLDRIDLFVQVPQVDYRKLMADDSAESSEVIRQRIETTRQRQHRRFEGTPFVCNADMTPVEAREFCRLDSAGTSLIEMAMRKFHLSARAFQRTLKLSRTIADLSGADTIAGPHVAEALQYRARGMA